MMYMLTIGALGVVAIFSIAFALANYTTKVDLLKKLEIPVDVSDDISLQAIDGGNELHINIFETTELTPGHYADFMGTMRDKLHKDFSIKVNVLTIEGDIEVFAGITHSENIYLKYNAYNSTADYASCKSKFTTEIGSGILAKTSNERRFNACIIIAQEFLNK